MEKLLRVLPFILLSFFNIVTPIKINPAKLYLYSYDLNGDKKTELIKIYKKEINKKLLKKHWWIEEKNNLPIFYCWDPYHEGIFKIIYDKNQNGYKNDDDEIGRGKLGEIEKIIYGRIE